MTKKPGARRFVVCISADGGIDLELRKVYEVVADDSAAQDGFIRVIDESGEDYLYPVAYFVPVDVSDETAETLHDASQSRSGATG
jgi:hypothetical protein